MKADDLAENERTVGPIDLAEMCASWEDLQRTRLAMAQRGLPDADQVQKIEERLGRQIAKRLEQHPLWPWIKAHPGVGGVRCARLLALIRDPMRFPGQKCTNGHTVPPIEAVGSDRSPGGPCPVETPEGACSGTLLPPRTTTGVKSLHKYLGLHAVDGHAPRRQKGHQADWNTKGKTLLLGPNGIADQIIKHRTEPWRSTYDAQLARLVAERGDVKGLYYIARKIAVKQFVGDLLVEWKRLVDKRAGDEVCDGEPQPLRTAA